MFSSQQVSPNICSARLRTCRLGHAGYRSGGERRLETCRSNFFAYSRASLSCFSWPRLSSKVRVNCMGAIAAARLEKSVGRRRLPSEREPVLQVSDRGMHSSLHESSHEWRCDALRVRVLPLNSLKRFPHPVCHR